MRQFSSVINQHHLILLLLTFILMGTTPGKISLVSAASASHRDKGSSLTTGSDWDDTPEEEEGYCAPYNGKVCKSFINSRQVWYSREDGTGGWENEKITAALFRDLINDLPDYCRPAAEVCTSGYDFTEGLYTFFL